MLRASLEKTLVEVVMISMFTLKVALVLISVEKNQLSSSLWKVSLEGQD